MLTNHFEVISYFQEAKHNSQLLYQHSGAWTQTPPDEKKNAGWLRASCGGKHSEVFGFIPCPVAWTKFSCLTTLPQNIFIVSAKYPCRSAKQGPLGVQDSSVIKVPIVILFLMRSAAGNSRCPRGTPDVIGFCLHHWLISPDSTCFKTETSRKSAAKSRQLRLVALPSGCGLFCPRAARIQIIKKTGLDCVH